MSKIFILMRAQLRATFRGNSSKRKASKVSGVGMIVLIGFFALIMALSFFAMFFGVSFQIKESTGSSYVLQSLAYIMAAVIMLFFTTFQAQATVFRAKDLDMLMAMPVTPFQILMSKIAAFYLSNLAFGAIVLVPAAAATMICEGFSFYTLTVLLLNLLTIPCITMTVSFILAFLLSLMPEKSKFNRVFSIIISFVFIITYFIFYSRLNDAIEALAQNSVAFSEAVQKYPPIFFLQQALSGNIWGLVLLVFVSVAIFLLFMYVLSKTYFRLIRRTNRSVYVKKTSKIIAEKASPAWLAVFKKEIGKYFSTSIYVVNTAFGIIILLALSVASLFGDSLIEGFSMIFDSGIASFIPLAVCAASCTLLLNTATACVSISLEGKNFWILRSAPVSNKDIFIGKALVNIVVAVPIWIVSSIILIFSMRLNLLEWLLIFLCGCGACVFCAIFGLLMNLCFPKLDALNETQVVKQSISSFLGAFGGVAVSIPGYIAPFFLTAISVPLALLAVLAYYLVICAIAYILLKFNGDKLMRRLVY